MSKLIAQPFVLAVREPVVDAITAISQDIWRVLAQIQLVPDLFQVLAVELVLAVADTEALLVAVDTLVDPAQLLVISVEDQTTLLGIVRLRP